MPPGACIVNHSSEDRGGFVDLGDRVVIDPRIYVSRQAVIDLGRLFAFPDPDEIKRITVAAAILRERVARLEDENAQLTRARDAAEYTLERRFQAKPQAKPGRKKVASNG